MLNRVAVMYRLYFEDSDPAIECPSLVALGQAIDQLHIQYLSKYPICAMLKLGRFNLIFGLGLEIGFTQVQVEPFDGEYYLSVGDPQAAGWIDFYGCGGHTPFEASVCVPFETVRAAVLAFATEQTLPAMISWHNWNGQPVRGQPWQPQ
jgi:Immunity protein Imm1